MADTDDEQTAELGPDHHAEGEDEKAPGAEAAGEDRRAKEWEAGADLARPAMALSTSDEDAEAEQHTRTREQIEQDARAERGLRDSRQWHDVNRAEVAEALRLAEVADAARADYRADAAGERRLARTDAARATHLRAGAAGRDDPAAEADRSRADRRQALSNYETGLANGDGVISDSYGADARDQVEAAQVRRLEQPSAADAARIPPQQAPPARKNLRRRRKTKELKDFGLGE